MDDISRSGYNLQSCLFLAKLFFTYHKFKNNSWKDKNEEMFTEVNTEFNFTNKI